MYSSRTSDLAGILLTSLQISVNMIRNWKDVSETHNFHRKYKNSKK